MLSLAFSSFLSLPQTYSPACPFPPNTGADVPLPALCSSFLRFLRLQSLHYFCWEVFPEPWTNSTTLYAFTASCIFPIKPLFKLAIACFIISLPCELCESSDLPIALISLTPFPAQCMAQGSEWRPPSLSAHLLCRSLPVLLCSCKIIKIPLKNVLLIQFCSFGFPPTAFSVKFKSDSDYFPKRLLIKIKANNEGLLRLKHLPNNTKKSSECYLQAHKYGPGMPAFNLKLLLGKQWSADIIISCLAYVTLQCKCHLWSLLSNHISLKSQLVLTFVAITLRPEMLPCGHPGRGPYSVLEAHIHLLQCSRPTGNKDYYSSVLQAPV